MGDVGFQASLAVLIPGLVGDEQIGVEHGQEAAVFDGQVNRDDAVFDFAQRPAVLPLYAGGFVSLLGHAGLVDQADDAQIIGFFSGSGQMSGDDAALGLLEQGVLVPGVMGEEFLERANRGAGGERDGLDAFAGQITEQAAAVGGQVIEGGPTRKASAKAAEELRQSRPQAGNLIFGHRPPCLLEVLPREDAPR